MGPRGSDPFIEQVRLASDIAEVVSGYLELRKAGRRLRGLCPFHGEKTPSFFVNQENQTFYCFGCQKGGDVFTFVMEQEKLTFPEALRHLADRAGIEMPRGRRPDGDGSGDRLGEAMEVAAEFFRSRLRAPEGEPARAYLARRGITEEEIDRYGIGFAPASWDALLRHGRRLLPERVLLQAGLVVEGERGLYDRFRDRVVLPIRTPGRRTAAFGGRLLGPGEPKYLNSPETPLYRKGTVLFGLPEARESIRREGNVLVVEGYFDVISLAAGGIGWTVGTCGTALTDEQALLLRRYAERWTLLFDGDRAGRAAILRALDAALPVHPGVRIAICPEGSDPDAWIRSAGAEAVRTTVERAESPLQYLERWAREEALAREQTLPRVAGLLGRLADPMVRDLWVQEAAGRFGLRERAIWEALRGRSPAPGGAGAARPREGGTGLSARERQIVAAAVRQPGIAADLAELCGEIPEIGPRCGEILGWVRVSHEAGIRDAAGLLSLASEEDPALLRDLSFLNEEGESQEQVPGDLVMRLRAMGLRSRMRELTDRIRRAEERGEGLDALLAEKQDLATRLRDVEALERLRHGNFP